MDSVDPRVFKAIAVLGAISTAYTVGARMYLWAVISAAVVLLAAKLHNSAEERSSV